MTFDHCPLCKHPNTEPYLTATDFTVSSERFHINRCPNCTALFTQNPPDESQIGPYYESDQYVSHSENKSGIINYLYHQVKKFNIRKKFNLVSAYTNGINVIDYGCGTGDFLSFCATKGWHAQGYEINDLARTKANRNLKITVASPEKLDEYPTGQANVITLWHVLEHIYPIHSLIKTLKNKLDDNGILVIAVPNPNSFDALHYQEFWAAYDVPRHLYHFTPRSLEALMVQHGFTRIHTHPMRFDSYYVSLLSEKYKSQGKITLLGLITGFITGLRSNIRAYKKPTYSSQIYVFQKS
ncbi:MAG TPA: class I SAM-dependent methyltransferase [Luteibaculaceae bacterium]|nr:class I SAM-dependent methyltransferase [Luteibaculaceae bacterium]